MVSSLACGLCPLLMPARSYTWYRPVWGLGSLVKLMIPIFDIFHANPFISRQPGLYRLVWGAIIALKGRLRSDGGGWMLRVVYGGYGNTKQQEAMAGCQGHIWGAFWHLRYLDHARTWYKQQQNMIIS